MPWHPHALRQQMRRLLHNLLFVCHGGRRMMQSPESVQFEFASAGRIYFGVGRCNELCAILKSVCGSCGVDPAAATPLVVCGSRVDQSRVGRIVSTLSEGSMQCTVFPVTGEPTVETVEEGTRVAQQSGCNVVVAVGGGSPIDTGKAVAALMTNGGSPLDYMEVIGKGQPLRVRAAPMITVPTTAGSGAELKVSMRHPLMLPTASVIDPQLTVSLPPAVTANTGLDALTQCLESFISCKANPLTDCVALSGLKHGARSLRVAYADGSNIPARTDMSLCALYGGLALANAKLGVVHGFAGVLGGMFPSAPHGGLCAAVLGAATQANAAALAAREPSNPALGKLQQAAEVVMGVPGAGVTDLVGWVSETCRLLDVKPLRVHGVRAADFEAIVEKASNSSSMKGNPLPLTKEELMGILTQATGSE